MTIRCVRKKMYVVIEFITWWIKSYGINLTYLFENPNIYEIVLIHENPKDAMFLILRTSAK